MAASASASGKVQSADGTPIAWERRGSGPPLVIVDPVLMDRRTSVAAGLAELLAPTRTVYTYDRRGKGESGDSADYEPSREVDDLLAVIEAAGGEADLYGFSSGAVLALMTAADSPAVTGVVALEPPLSGSVEDTPDIRGQLQDLVNAGERAEAVRLFQRSIGVPEEMVQASDVEVFAPAAHTIAYDLTLNAEADPGSLGGIRVPVLVLVSGGSDPRLHEWARETAEAMADARLEVLEGGWHGVQDQVLAEAINGFLA